MERIFLSGCKWVKMTPRYTFLKVSKMAKTVVYITIFMEKQQQKANGIFRSLSETMQTSAVPKGLDSSLQQCLSQTCKLTIIMTKEMDFRQQQEMRIWLTFGLYVVRVRIMSVRICCSLIHGTNVVQLDRDLIRQLHSTNRLTYLTLTTASFAPCPHNLTAITHTC